MYDHKAGLSTVQTQHVFNISSGVQTCQQLRHAGLNKASNTQPVSE